MVVGILLAYVMKPVFDRVQGFGIGRIPSILLTFVFVFGALTAAQVTAVDPDGPAEEAGIRPGDAIMAVEGSNREGC